MNEILKSDFFEVGKDGVKKIYTPEDKKIDIVEWNENPAILIENALNPAQVICVIADEEEKTAQVIVPDNQLSLAIGKVGQNARLAARLTGYKIDIMNETKARENGLFDEIEGLDNDDEYIGYREFEEEESEDDGEELTFADIQITED